MMGEMLDPECQMIFEKNFHLSIDPKRARFPCCIVWTPLPVISWLIPFIGHIGICRADEIILDFAAPNFVSVDSFAFGAVARYIQISKEKDCSIPLQQCSFNSENQGDVGINGRDALTWDGALQKSTQEFQHHSYSLFTCNCHSFVANNLNRLGYHSGGWSVVNLAAVMFLQGQWVSAGSMVRSYLPFFFVFGAGLILGGLTFLTFWAFFTFFLVGWFLLGTYGFKNLIQL